MVRRHLVDTQGRNSIPAICSPQGGWDSSLGPHPKHPRPAEIGTPRSVGGSEVKASACNLGPLGQEDPLEKGLATHSSTLGLENLVDREAWWATVHGVAKRPT